MREVSATLSTRRASPFVVQASIFLAVAAVFFGGLAAVWGLPPFGVYLAGAVVGTLYALVAIGIILVFRANRIINFATASLGGVPAVLGTSLMIQRHVPFLLAVCVVVVGAILVGVVVETAVIRRFSNSPRLILTLATIGVAQLLAFFELMVPRWVGGDVSFFNVVTTPFSRYERFVGGVNFNGNHLVTVVTVVCLTLALAAFFRFTRMGMAVRASAENADRASLLGVPVRRVVTVVWVLAAVLSAVGMAQRSVLLGTTGVGASATSLVLFGLVPAVIARMESLPTALVAGIALGVAEQSIVYSSRNSTIPGAILLPVVLVALLMQRGLTRSQDTGISTFRDVKEFRGIPTELRAVRAVVVATWGVRAAIVGLVLAAPALAGAGREDLASLLAIYAIAGISLVILTGWAGQISLGQFAFCGVGAAVAGGLTVTHGIHPIACVIAAGAVGALLAVVIGIPAVRLPGLFLAVATLLFARNAQFFFLQHRYFPWVVPRADEHVPRPQIRGLDLSDDTAFYYATVAMLILAVAVAQSIRSHRFGRVMIAIRDNPRAAQSLGINAARVRLVAFATSGFLAAVAGALLAFLQGSVNPDLFTPERSLILFSMVVIGGMTSVGGALAGALYVVGFQYFLPDYALLSSGVGMLGLLLFFPGGLSELGFSVRDAYLRRIAAKQDIHVPSLVADSGRGAIDPRADEEALLSDVPAAATAVTGGGRTGRRRASLATQADESRVPTPGGSGR